MSGVSKPISSDTVMLGSLCCLYDEPQVTLAFLLIVSWSKSVSRSEISRNRVTVMNLVVSVIVVIVGAVSYV
jgi:hypothetical protein